MHQDTVLEAAIDPPPQTPATLLSDLHLLDPSLQCSHPPRQGQPFAFRQFTLRVFSSGLAFLIAGLLQTCFAQESVFLVDELELTYSLASPREQGVTILVRSSDKPIRDTNIDIVSVRAPSGVLLAVSAVEKVSSIAEVTDKGKAVSIKFDQSKFATSGTYKVGILISGSVLDASEESEGDRAQTTTANFFTLLVDRPAATVNAEELKNLQISLYRPYPFATAGGSLTLDLRETSKKSDAYLNLQSQTLNRKDSKSQVTGNVAISASNPVHVLAGQAKQVNVSFSDIAQTGELTTSLLVESEQLAETVVLPLQIRVSDYWICPLLVIALGVLGGSLVTMAVTYWQPGLNNRLDIDRLRGQIMRLRRLVTKTLKREQLGSLLTLLIAAEEKTSLNKPSEAAELIKGVATDLQKVAAGEIAQLDKLETDLQTLRLQHQSYSKAPETQTASLNQILEFMNQVQRLIELGRGDEASETLSQAQASFDALRRADLRTDLDALLERCSRLGAPAIQQRIQDAILQLETASKLDTLSKNVKSMETEISQLEAASAASSEGVQARLVKKDALRSQSLPQNATYIYVHSPPEQRLPGRPLDFKLHDGQGLFVEPRQIRWDFGDGRSETTNGLIASHEYDVAGTYSVRAICDGVEDLLPSPLQCSVVLLPLVSAARRRAFLQLNLIEIYLSIIALFVACLTGMNYLYFDKVFGAPTHYVGAFLWGFGIENGVRGFAAVYNKIRGQA